MPSHCRRSRAVPCIARSRTANRAPSRLSTPSAWSRAPSAPLKSVCTVSAATEPVKRTGPATLPASGSPDTLLRSPSNEIESATTSAATPRVSVRLSSRTVPRIWLMGRSPSRCASVPLNCASASEPVSVPAAASVPRNATEGTSWRTVPRSTLAASTANGRKASPARLLSEPSTLTVPRPFTRLTGHPGTSESRNAQSTSSVRASSRPSAVV